MNYGQKPPGPQQPWSQPGAPQWAPQPYGAPPSGMPQNPYAVPNAPGAGYAMPMMQASNYGDAAGEHLNMQRGRYRAMVYVGMAFLMQIGIVTCLFLVPAALIAGAADLNDDATGMITMAAGGTGFVGGIVLSYFMFRDRWKCIEAFSSRFCSGLMNLSMMYVPFIALVYANVRAIQKLSGR